MGRASSPGTTTGHIRVLSPPCSAATGLPLELPFPSPHLIAERQKLISLWHKLILMSPVPSDSSQTAREALQGKAGGSMTYGPCSPRRPAASDGSGHLQPPLNQLRRSNLESCPARPLARLVPLAGASQVRGHRLCGSKRVTSSRLTHPSQPLGMDCKREAVAVLSSFEL